MIYIVTIKSLKWQKWDYMNKRYTQHKIIYNHIFTLQEQSLTFKFPFSETQMDLNTDLATIINNIGILVIVVDTTYLVLIGPWC